MSVFKNLMLAKIYLEYRNKMCIFRGQSKRYQNLKKLEKTVVFPYCSINDQIIIYDYITTAILFGK